MFFTFKIYYNVYFFYELFLISLALMQYYQFFFCIFRFGLAIEGQSGDEKINYETKDEVVVELM